jgi:tRNA threonylcarbamoyladenosine biosynthesis protein TsaB
VFSAALVENGKIVNEIFNKTRFSSSEKLIPAIDKILKQAKWKLEELDKIAVSIGPGSFTGIRVGVSCARYLGQGLKIDIVGVDALEILKHGVITKNICNVCPAIDALRNELFVKNAKGIIEIIKAENFIDKLSIKLAMTEVVGSGVWVLQNFGKSIPKNVVFAKDKFNYPRAGALGLTAEKISGKNYKNIMPLYVRRSWAEENI